jgi:hypothetical protein
MAFSDSIDRDMLLTGVRFMRESNAQDANGDYTTVATTISHTVKGDIQPATLGSYMASQAGSDYRITHRGFFDVPATVPAEGDKCVAGSLSYQVRNVRDFKTHMELDMERLGI